MNKFINFDGKKSGISWLAIAGFLLIFCVLFAALFSWVESLFGIAFLVAISFVLALVIFNQGAVESFLTLKWWNRTSTSTPFKEDNNPRLKDIPAIKISIDKLKDKNDELDF
jgi:hypothetical protein